MSGVERLRQFVGEWTRLVEGAADDEPRLLDQGSRLLERLIAHDDWLPDRFAEPDPHHYRQYLLHCDPLERLSVVSFVWGPGVASPIHDHTVWGLIGVLRGAEVCEEFSRDEAGLRAGGSHRLEAGAVDRVSPAIGDIHRVSNALDDAESVSIHVYGANIGGLRRHVFDERTGQPSAFVSGYSNALVPNLWDRSGPG